MGTGASVDLRARTDNPFRESQLGYRLWEKGWRPCSTHRCDCGALSDVKFKPGRTPMCSGCKREFHPLWEHAQVAQPMRPYDIWAEIVKRRWQVDINASRSYGNLRLVPTVTEDEPSEAEIERLKQERVI